MPLDSVKRLAAQENLPLHTVAAEVIQIAFLDALYGQKESTDIVFHGGTSIRLLHGGYRYSEDLDFVVTALDRRPLEAVLERAARTTEQLLTTIIGPLTVELTARPAGEKNVWTWWLKACPRDYRGKVHVKLEFGRYPVYQPRSFPVMRRHPLIDAQPITIAPSIDELFLDKINALAGRQYLKNRDFFDMWYMVTVLKPVIDYRLLVAKFADYRNENPVGTLKKRLTELDPTLVAATMEIFLPERYRRTLGVNRYTEVIEVNKRLINDLLQNLEVGVSKDE